MRKNSEIQSKSWITVFFVFIENLITPYLWFQKVYKAELSFNIRSQSPQFPWGGHLCLRLISRLFTYGGFGCSEKDKNTQKIPWDVSVPEQFWTKEQIQWRGFQLDVEYYFRLPRYFCTSHHRDWSKKRLHTQWNRSKKKNQSGLARPSYFLPSWCQSYVFSMSDDWLIVLIA